MMNGEGRKTDLSKVSSPKMTSSSFTHSLSCSPGQEQADPDVITTFSLFFFLNIIFYEHVERKKEQHLAKTCVFLKGLEQTWFCRTLGNRSVRLSSGKLWANINEAFKLEREKKRGTLAAMSKMLEASESWTGYCKIVRNTFTENCLDYWSHTKAFEGLVYVTKWFLQTLSGSEFSSTTSSVKRV